MIKVRFPYCITHPEYWRYRTFMVKTIQCSYIHSATEQDMSIVKRERTKRKKFPKHSIRFTQCYKTYQCTKHFRFTAITLPYLCITKRNMIKRLYDDKTYKLLNARTAFSREASGPLGSTTVLWCVPLHSVPYITLLQYVFVWSILCSWPPRTISHWSRVFKLLFLIFFREAIHQPRIN